ncbi:MAG: hypothetical protein DMG93_08575 [Acidobacteria bacterium]|nr:MAG: hypothetical protein DMG93_08575 [Acidobacteriota bacterium]
MKVGAENRTKVILAIALGVVLLIVIATQMGGWFGGASSSAAAPPVPRVTTATEDLPARRTGGRARTAATKKDTAARSMDPSLRLDLLKASEDTKYEGTGRNIFRVFVEIPKIRQQPAGPQAPPQQAAYVPPPPPPINLTFYGFATPTGGTKRIFLAQGEDVFIAKEGDIVDRRYKVVRISQNAVEILDVLSNNRQSIPLTQG